MPCARTWRRARALRIPSRGHPAVFPELLVQMAKAGEASGSLDTAMERMAVQFEKSAKTQAMVKKAMIYPIVVALVAVAVVIIMLVFVIPRYMDMFEQLGTELPAITMAVVNLSNFIQNNWYIIIPVVAGIVFALKAYAKTSSGKHVFGKLQMKIPAVKNLVVKSASAQMARTLSTLLTAGVPLMEAVDIVGYHYNPYDDSQGNFKKLAEQYDKEIWNSEAQATFGSTADRPNNNMKEQDNTAGTGIGGNGGPLEMADTAIKGFVNSRRTHFVYQPTFGAFYEGCQYNYKDVMSARDPWSGYVNYDAAHEYFPALYEIRGYRLGR